MGAGQDTVSFDSIIQADRQKKRNEQLANNLLGKNRRASAPGSGVGKKTQNATPGSLASRIGVTKRSASTNSRTRKSQPPVSAPTGPRGSQLRPANGRRADNNRLAAALNNTVGQATVRDNSAGISIKGASGPFTVVGSNFAPGTTAADIQSAVEPIAGQTLSCLVTSNRPTVVAEIVFAERSSAEAVIANFHNQKADGQILSMRLKPVDTRHDLFNPPSGPRAWTQPLHSQSTFDDLREQADQQRRQQRRADPAVQDGRYGFNESNNPLDRNDRGGNSRYNRRQNGRQNVYGSGQPRGGRQDAQQSGLYSDEMMVDAPPQNPRNRGRR